MTKGKGTIGDNKKMLLEKQKSGDSGGADKDPRDFDHFKNMLSALGDQKKLLIEKQKSLDPTGDREREPEQRNAVRANPLNDVKITNKKGVINFN
jgi:hypothetical protein